MVRDAQTLHDLLVEHANATGRDGTHCQLLVTRDAQLAHDKHIKGCTERAGDFICDGNTTPRQRQHKQIRAIRVSGELRGEESARLAAIAKESWPEHFWLYVHVLLSLTGACKIPSICDVRTSTVTTWPLPSASNKSAITRPHNRLPRTISLVRSPVDRPLHGGGCPQEAEVR